ncbi:MAG: oligosaccharide flippase family protein [Bacteroidales bacterium]|nr:oligosaccharide flippase family protein [Bacteroidales bacterium]
MSFKGLINREGNTIQAMWVAMGSLSSFALAIVSAAILSRYFNKTDYGTYRQILYVYSTLLIVFAAGLPTVFSYFLPRYSLEQGKDIVWKVTKVLFLLGAFFSIFLFGFSGIIADLLKNPELKTGLKYFSPIPMLLFPTLGIEGIFSTYKKSIYIAIYNTLSRLLMLLFIVLPVIILKGSYLYAIYGWIVVSVISLILAFRFKQIPFRGILSEKSGLSYREVFGYSLPMVAASIWGIAIRSADQFYISRFFGAEVFAEFSNGFIDIPFVGMVTGATSTVLMPMFSKMIHDKSNIEDVLNLWKSALLKSAMIIYPVVFFFLFNAKNVVVFLYSDTYTNSAVFFQISMMVNFFNIIVFIPLILAMGKTRFYSRVHAAMAICAWALGYAVVLIFNSPVSIAILSVVISIVKILIFVLFVAKLFGISPIKLFPVDKILVLSIHSIITMVVITAGIRYLLPDMELFVELILSLTGFVVLLLLTSKLVRINYLMLLDPILKSRSR